MKKEILGIAAPEQPGSRFDKNDPYYGSINVKQETIVGTVIRKDAHGSATIEWERMVDVPKYERKDKRRSRIRVHNPASVNAQIGDKVLVAKTRPISKSKHHVILRVMRDEQ